MTARGEEQMDSLLYSLRRSAESQLQECKDYFGPKHHEMQDKLHNLLSGMNSWTKEFPHIASIPQGKGHAAAARKMVLRHHCTAEGANKEVLPCELGGIGRIPVRHDFFAKQEPAIVPIGGHVPEYDVGCQGAVRGRGPSQKNAKHLGQTENVNVHAQSPPIRDCHVVLDKIPKKKLQKVVQLHIDDFDEASSYCSETSRDSDYIPLHAEGDCPSSDGGEEDAGWPPLLEKDPLQSTGDNSLNIRTKDRRDVLARMGGVVSGSSTVNEAEAFVGDDSTQLSRASCIVEEMPPDQRLENDPIGLASSPSTGVLSGPGDFEQESDNDSLPDNMADSDVCTTQSPPNSPSLLDHSSDRLHCATPADKAACTADVPGIVSTATAEIDCALTPEISDSDLDLRGQGDLARMEMATHCADTGAPADIVSTEVAEDVAGKGGSEIAAASGKDDLLLSSKDGSPSQSPLPPDLARSTPAVSGCSLTGSAGVLEDALSHLPNNWHNSPGDSCTPPLSNLRDCTQSSPEHTEYQMDTSADLFTHESSPVDDRHLCISEGDTQLSASVVSSSPVPSPTATLDIEMEHSYFTQPVRGSEADLNESNLSSRSAPPAIGSRKGKSMKLLRRRRLLSSPSLSPLEPSLSSGVESKHESPTSPKAKRPCIRSEEDAMEAHPSVQAQGKTSVTCKAHQVDMEWDESPSVLPDAPFRQQEEGCSSTSVVPSSPLRDDTACRVEGKGGAISAANAEKEGSDVSPTTGQTPSSRLRVVRGRKSRHGSCIACGKNFMLNADQKVAKHPKLDAFICLECHTFYFSGEFTMSGDKQNECFVCGDGGKVVECDTPGELCPHSVCFKCIRRLEGGVKVKRLESDKGVDFFCYECDPGPIQHLFSAFKRGSLTLGWKVKEEKEEVKNDLEKNEPLDEGKVDSLQMGGQNSSSDRQEQDVLADTSNNEAGKQEGDTKNASKIHSKKGNGVSPESECGSHSSGLDSASSSDTELSSDSELPDLQFCTNMSGSKENECPEEMERDSCGLTASTEKVDSAGDSSKEGPSKQRKQDKKAILRQTFTNRHTWRKGSTSGAGSELESETDGHEREILKGVEEEGEGVEDEMQAEPPKNDTDNAGKKKTPGKKRINRFLNDTSSEDDLPQPRIELLEKPEGELRVEEVYEEVPEVKYSTQGTRKVVFSDSEGEDFCKPEKKPKKEPLEEKESTEEDEVDKDRTDQILTDAQKKTKEKKKNRRKGRAPKARYMILDSDYEDNGEVEEGNDSIIVLSDDSESDKKEAETPPSQKKDVHARRNIRKIMSKQKLTSLTKQAQKEEQDRQKRLKERGELDLGGDRLILEGTEEEPVFEIRRSLVAFLKPHQRDGVRFLWDYTCESVEKISDDVGSGALLAHCMGLGKTLQVIAFLDALLYNEATGLKRMLVIVPKNTISNWVDEFQRWLNDENDYYVINFNQYKSKAEQAQVIESWHLRGGVGIISYDTYRILTSVKGVSKRTPGQRKKLHRCLRDPGPDIVVCDEGHVLRNCKSALSQAVNQVATQRRIVLTGTPLQNNLQEYYTMVSFVKPNLLGTLREFNNRFGNPIKNGQCRDATAFDVILMKRRAHVLNRLLSGCVQRKDYRVLTECLPSKHEYVMKIRLSPQQEQLYCTILEQRGSDGVIQSIFKFFQVMLRVWNHPWMLRLYEERKEVDDDDDDDSGSDLGGFICDDSEEELAEIEHRANAKKKTKAGIRMKRGSSRSSSSTPSSSSVSTPTSPSPVLPVKASGELMAEPSAVDKCSGGPSLMSGLVHFNNVGSSSGCPVIVDLTEEAGGTPRDLCEPEGTPHDVCEPEGKPHDVCEPEGKPHGFWYDKVLSDDMEDMIELSGKLLFLRELLVETKRLGEKVLVFSQSLLTLDVIEHFLHREEFGSLTPDLDYFRLDGATATSDRATMTRSFNCSKEKRVRLFLISTRAGSLGINLVSANRVVIFDACWNPSHDLQALFRVYRYGQTKPVFIYRLIAKGTMEEKIYDRQVTKEAIALRVVDKKQIDRHFSNADLSELLVYSPAPPPQELVDQERPEADPLLCGILDKLQPKWLLSYHCHDSLLVHREFEELSQTDKDSAWEEYLSSVRQVEGQAYYATAGMPEQQGVQMPTGVSSATVGVPIGQQIMHPLQGQQQWGPGMFLPPAAMQQQPRLAPNTTLLNQRQGVPPNAYVMPSPDLRNLSTTAQTIREIFQQRDIDTELVHLAYATRRGNQEVTLQLREQIIKKLTERDAILKKVKEMLHGIQSVMGPAVTGSREFKDIQDVAARASAALSTYSTVLQKLPTR